MDRAVDRQSTRQSTGPRALDSIALTEVVGMVEADRRTDKGRGRVEVEEGISEVGWVKGYRALLLLAEAVDRGLGERGEEK